eukprot:COSAG01_NODE_59626_length_299_cov_0.875000_1_plen_72_part_01
MSMRNLREAQLETFGGIREMSQPKFTLGYTLTHEALRQALETPWARTVQRNTPAMVSNANRDSKAMMMLRFY